MSRMAQKTKQPLLLSKEEAGTGLMRGLDVCKVLGLEMNRPTASDTKNMIQCWHSRWSLPRDGSATVTHRVVKISKDSIREMGSNRDRDAREQVQAFESSR